MYINKVELCGVNTAKLKVMKEKEKQELLLRVREGDTSARDMLVEGNLRLVLSVVQKFTQRGENLDDLFQVGCIGLIKAIDNFNIDLQLRFSTYAVPMIIGEIRRYLRDNNSIRVSRSLKDTAYKAMQVKEMLINRNGKEPTIEEISKEMGQKKADVVLALESIVSPVSLSEPLYSDGTDTVYVMDQISDKTSESDWLSSMSIRDTIKELNSREKNILTKRFFEGKTQMEVAKEIGISQAQVSRLEKGAIDKIKEKL
ncbi:MAG: RNA polymerase sporulation sigma factor SigG [Oscillospiraceae bacterium]